MSRVTITLETEEREALTQLALRELRTPRDQARYLLRQALVERGALPEGRILNGIGGEHG